MTINKQIFLRTVLAVSAVTLCVLTGCGIGPGSSVLVPSPVSIDAGKVQGIVMGGQQPVAAISLQLYAVGTSGYGSAATPLLTPGAVMTTASGNFTFPAFTCPTAGSLVYMVGTGGQPIAANGSIPAVTNNNLALMVGLGACSNITNQFIDMNEVTTVATVWALSPFMTGIANVGSSATNTTGIANAFASINTMVNTTNGAVSGPTLPAGATLPVAEINTLADILAYCVNSAGGSASDSTNGSYGTNCGNLFYLAGGTQTTDTVSAALQIALNPARNVAALNNLRDGSPPFQPPLSVNTPPTAWTIMINYTGGGLNAPSSIAADTAGNIWVANNGGNSVSKFQPNGVALSGTSGFTAGNLNSPSAVAIDTNGNAWVASKGNNSLVKLSADGSTGTPYMNNGLSSPSSVAIDAASNIWVTNSGISSVSAFTSAGAALAGSPYTGGGVSSPLAIAIDPK